MKQLKTIWIIIVVLAVLQIIGGSVYTAWTVDNERRYTYVDCVIVDITAVADGDSYTVEAVLVEYEADGKTVSAKLVDYPSKMEIGTTVHGRYDQSVQEISCKTTDWFTPIFLLCLGVAYAIGAALAFVFRKKMGLYVIVDEVGGNECIEDDGWTLLDDADVIEPQTLADDE